jgi:hypothetical protein
MAATVIDARPMQVDLNVYAGDDLTLRIDVTDNAGAAFDLTGYTPAAQVRATADAGTAIDFDATVLANTVTVSLDSATTETLPQKAVWDVQVTSATGVVTTLAGGKVTVYAGVTV